LKRGFLKKRRKKKRKRRNSLRRALEAARLEMCPLALLGSHAL
jgi:hypothetical protein